MDWTLYAQALLGIVVFTALALPFSSAPRKVDWKLVGSAIAAKWEEGVGIVVESPDGRLQYDNTLETRLNRLQSALRSSVYQVLMGEKL